MDKFDAMKEFVRVVEKGRRSHYAPNSTHDSVNDWMQGLKSPRELLMALVGKLRQVAKAGISLPADCTFPGTGSLKGIVQRALEHTHRT